MLRKKWLSFLVAVSMVAAMLPTTAFAEGSTVPDESTTTVVETATDENESQNTEGEPSEEEKSEDEVSEGEKPNDDKSEGEVSEEEKAEGETNEGETNEDKTPAETPVTPAPETTETTEATEAPAPETPAAGNSAVDTQTLTDGDETDDGINTINTEAELRAALVEGATIKLAGEIQLTSMLSITANDVTLNLDKYTITAADNFRSTYENDKHLVDITGDNVTIENGTLATTAANKHVVNVYGASNLVLRDVTLDHTDAEKGAPLVINGGANADDSASVMLAGKVTFVTGEGSWGYSVNMEKKNGSAVSLTVADNADVTFGNKTTGIYVQGADASLTFGKNILISGCENPLAIGGTDTQVEGLDNAGINPAQAGMVARVGNVDYKDFNDAVTALEAATSDCTLTLYKGVKLDRHINVPAVKVTIEGNGYTIELPAGQDDKAFTNSSIKATQRLRLVTV